MHTCTGFRRCVPNCCFSFFSPRSPFSGQPRFDVFFCIRREFSTFSRNFSLPHVCAVDFRFPVLIFISLFLLFFLFRCSTHRGSQMFYFLLSFPSLNGHLQWISSYFFLIFCDLICVLYHLVHFIAIMINFSLVVCRRCFNSSYESSANVCLYPQITLRSMAKWVFFLCL